MKQLKPFRFKVRKEARPKDGPLNRLDRPATEDEQFSGVIQDLPASDLEERSARAIRKLGLGFTFRQAFFAGRGMSGEVELDFMIYDGPVIIPVQVDGDYAHGSEKQKAHDAQQDAILNAELAKQGARTVVRIPSWKVIDQETADRTFRELI